MNQQTWNIMRDELPRIKQIVCEEYKIKYGVPHLTPERVVNIAVNKYNVTFRIRFDSGLSSYYMMDKEVFMDVVV